MFKHQLEQEASKDIIANWFLMSFSAGCINAGGFLATGRFVSHVTGFATLSGVDIANQAYDSAIGILSVPFFFLFGSFFAGMLIDRPLYKKKKPHFDYVMALCSLCLLLSAFSEELFLSGKFGGVFQLKQSYVLMALLCLACGLQNAALTSASGKTIRTTHLTGLTTDLGIGLARLFTLKKGTDVYRKENYVNSLRVGSILSFVVGSMAGASFFIKLGYRGFIVSAMISLYAAWHGRRDKIAMHAPNYP